jgi:hypothetical protein
MSEPTQPTEPVPPVPPVPRYGEYAPPGYVSPVQPVSPAAPQYGQAGEYGQGGQPFGAASYPAQPGARRRKTWDLVLTIVLLALGLFGMLIGLVYAAIFADPATLDAVFEQQGLNGFNGEVGAAPAVISVSHVLLYLVALGGSIPLLIGKRVAFWLPLVAGVIAAVIFWATLIGVFLSDPTFVSTYSS